MLSAILPLLLLTLCALALAYLLDRRFEALLPPVMLGVMLLLYAFYALNLLRAGFIVTVTVLCITPAFALYRMLRRRELSRFLQQFVLTPQMLVYAGLLTAFYFLSQGKQVAIWDTLRLWGALPKALHYYGTLQFGEEASLFIFSQSYPPAIPLLGYFFTAFTPVFSESALFFARMFFGLALLLPLTRGLSWKHWHGLLLLSFLMVFVPFYLTTNDPDFAYYYESLYVDAPAGLLCGYLCWLAMDGCYKDRFSATAFAIALAALTLTKDFGILYGGLCVLGSMVYLRRAARAKNLTPALYRAGAAVLALGASYLSWQLLLRAYHVVNYNTVTATIPTMQALFASLSYLLSSSITVPLSLASVTVSLGAVLLLFLLLYALFVYRSREALRQDLPFIALRVIGYGGYFFAYVMLFRDDIAGGVYPSIARYMVAMLLCETVVFLMALTRTSQERGGFLHTPFAALGTGKKATAILLAAALLLLSGFTVSTFYQYDGGVDRDAREAAALVTAHTEKRGRGDCRCMAADRRRRMGERPAAPPRVLQSDRHRRTHQALHPANQHHTERAGILAAVLSCRAGGWGLRIRAIVIRRRRNKGRVRKSFPRTHPL